MSDTDSFIEEVSEEVRRDQLFQMYKKYGWIAAALILLIVGGAAFLEYQKASAISEAQSSGDALVEALNIDDVTARSDALDALLSQKEGDQRALVLLQKAGVSLEAGNDADALAQFEAVQTIAGIDPIYSDLAALKAIMLQSNDLDADMRISKLEALAGASQPYRVLALEQIALAQVDAGRVEEAIEAMNRLLEEPDVTSGQRARITQIILALGGEFDPSANLLSNGSGSQ